MKNLIVFCFAAFLSQAAFAQQTSATPAPDQSKTGASCSDGSTTTTVNPAAAAPKTGIVKKVAVANGDLKMM